MMLCVAAAPIASLPQFCAGGLVVRRIALLAGFGVSVVFAVGCTQPEGDRDAQASEESAAIAKAEPAEETTPPNDVLSLPDDSSQRPAAAPPPVSKAQPLPRSQYAEPAASQARVHVVQPGETLYSIAKRYYGQGKQWRRVFQANKNRIIDPNRIKAGMKLIIP